MELKTPIPIQFTEVKLVREKFFSNMVDAIAEITDKSSMVMVINKNGGINGRAFFAIGAKTA